MMSANGSGRGLDDAQGRLPARGASRLIEAVDWYEARGRGLGAEFIRSLESAISIVQRHPATYPLVFGAARRAVLRKFPYSLIYVATDREILIVACIHGRRDPHRWQTRV